jgi:EmrB/QacA subfamily drug resistance transporter
MPIFNTYADLLGGYRLSEEFLNETIQPRYSFEMSNDSMPSGGGVTGILAPVGVPVPRRTVALILGGLLTGLLLGFMDVTIVATAGPTIIADLGGLSLYAWVFSSFVIVQTVVIPIFGKLSDIYGRKRFFLLGLVVFMVGSALSGAAQNIYELIGFRALQGIGFGAFVPTTLAIAGDLFPPERRGRIQGLLFSVNGIAFAVAPAVGSYLTESINWRWIFYINLPLGVVSFVIIYLSLRESKNERATGFSDWLGAGVLTTFLGLLMLGIFLGLLMLGIFLGGNTFSWDSIQELGLFAGAGVALVSLAFVEGRAKDPVLPPRLFRIRTISAATAVNILRALALFGLIAYLPLYAQAVLNASIGDVRNVVYSLALPLTAGILVSGAFIPRLGAKNMILVGAGILIVALVALFLSLGSSTSLVQLMELCAPLGFGSGLMIPPAIVAFQNSVQRNEIGVASGLAAFTLNLGSAIGVAALGAIQTNQFSSRLSTLFASHPLPAGSLLRDPNTVGQLLASPQYLAKAIAANPSLQALVPQLREAFSQSILFLIPIVLVAGVAAFLGGLLIKNREKAGEVGPTPVR